MTRHADAENHFDPAALAPRITLRRVEDLVPYARNSRTHDASQIADLKGAILHFGWTNPIIADEKGIVAGHGRTMAARELYEAGMTLRFPGGAEIPAGMVPVIDCSGWSEGDRKAYVIFDNKSALKAGWDVELLKAEMLDLEELGIDLSLTGFSTGEIDILNGGLGGVDISPEDSGESASGVDGDYLTFAGVKIPMSADEAMQLKLLHGRYAEEYGLSHGFARWLCEGRNAA